MSYWIRVKPLKKCHIEYQSSILKVLNNRTVGWLQIDEQLVSDFRDKVIIFSSRDYSAFNLSEGVGTPRYYQSVSEYCMPEFPGGRVDTLPSDWSQVTLGIKTQSRGVIKAQSKSEFVRVSFWVNLCTTDAGGCQRALPHNIKHDVIPNSGFVSCCHRDRTDITFAPNDWLNKKRPSACCFSGKFCTKKSCLKLKSL